MSAVQGVVPITKPVRRRTVSLYIVLTANLWGLEISVLLARDFNTYISRLCYDVSVRLSVCDGSALAHYS